MFLEFLLGFTINGQIMLIKFACVRTHITIKNIALHLLEGLPHIVVSPNCNKR